MSHTKYPRIYGIYGAEPQEDLFGANKIIIEEYLHGTTIAERLEETGIFSEKETIELILQLCRILMDLHGCRPAIVHRDIKPSNVLISRDGTLKLLDFNAAKAENVMQSRDTVLIGTAGYAAPEQYGFSASSPQTDLYAVGVLMNVMLTGKLPTEKLAGGKLKSVIKCCLEVNPKDRYEDVKKLYAALKRISQVKSEWLLPGFRTMRIYKMLLAMAGYGFLLAIAFTTKFHSTESTAQKYLYRFSVLSVGFLLVCFFCDYLQIRRWFPFMRSSHKGLRILGYVLGPILIFWIIMIPVSLFEVWFLK